MTIIRWLIVSLVIIASCNIGRCDELVGQASIIDGDTHWKSMERAFDCGASTRRIARSFVAAMIAIDTSVVRRRPTT